MAASSYFLLLFLVPLKNKFVNILALPDEDNDSYLEPPLKKMETELPWFLYFSVKICALLLRIVYLNSGDY